MDLSFVLRRTLLAILAFLHCAPPPTRIPTATPTAGHADQAEPATVPPAETLRWHGRMANRALVVHDGNGSIDAFPADGDEAEIVATKSGDGAERVDIVVSEDSAGVVTCLRERTADGEPADACLHHRSHVRDFDVRVHFTVRVPAGSRFEAHTRNGDVRAESLAQRALVSTVNGAISLVGTVPLRATTVNGSVAVVLPRDWTEDAEVAAVNGSIDVSVPAANGDVDLVARAVRGDVVLRGAAPRREAARLVHIMRGHGGPTLFAHTVNGSIHLDTAS